jgi:hypothetical protein
MGAWRAGYGHPRRWRRWLGVGVNTVGDRHLRRRQFRRLAGAVGWRQAPPEMSLPEVCRGCRLEVKKANKERVGRLAPPEMGTSGDAQVGLGDQVTSSGLMRRAGCSLRQAPPPEMVRRLRRGELVERAMRVCDASGTSATSSRVWYGWDSLSSVGAWRLVERPAAGTSGDGPLGRGWLCGGRWVSRSFEVQRRGAGGANVAHGARAGCGAVSSSRGLGGGGRLVELARRGSSGTVFAASIRGRRRVVVLVVQSSRPRRPRRRAGVRGAASRRVVRAPPEMAGLVKLASTGTSGGGWWCAVARSRSSAPPEMGRRGCAACGACGRRVAGVASSSRWRRGVALLGCPGRSPGVEGSCC